MKKVFTSKVKICLIVCSSKMKMLLGGKCIQKCGNPFDVCSSKKKVCTLLENLSTKVEMLETIFACVVLFNSLLVESIFTKYWSKVWGGVQPHDHIPTLFLSYEHVFLCVFVCFLRRKKTNSCIHPKSTLAGYFIFHTIV